MRNLKQVANKVSKSIHIDINSKVFTSSFFLHAVSKLLLNDELHKLTCSQSIKIFKMLLCLKNYSFYF